MSTTKELRNYILDYRDTTPKARHSLNQDTLGKNLDSERLFFGTKSKATRANRRRALDEWYKTEYPTTKSQLARSLEAVLDGGATDGHTRYVLDHLDEFARPLTPSERRLVGIDTNVDISIFKSTSKVV